MHKIIVITGTSILMLLTNVISKPSLASEELFRLCSQFPHNSRCAEYDVPIPLSRYQGESAQCKDEESQKFMACTVIWSSSGVVVYSEFGKKLDVLKGKRATKKSEIALSNIDTLVYAEKSKADEAAVIALGVWGLLARIKLSTITIQYAGGHAENDANSSNLAADNKLDVDIRMSDVVDDNDESTARSHAGDTSINKVPKKQQVIVMKRKSGQGMIQFLEFITGKKAIRS